jgi:(E)-4-hydroxy-3-methylbut-2-enyl-diphosphate synthase
MNIVKNTVLIGGNGVKKVALGDKKNVAIQSMCNTKTSDWKTTVEQIHALEKEKCEMVRVAVPDKNSAKSLSKIKEHISIPLIADIHFDHKLAIESIKAGADKIRINPGNIGSKDRVLEVIKAAKKANVVIRIGVNAGSLEDEFLKKFKEPTAEALYESAKKHCDFFAAQGFQNIVVSMKTSDVKDTIKAYRLAAKNLPHPLHIGITEAGTRRLGTVKNAIGTGVLLLAGIGDTIRVSLCDDPLEEVKVAKDILKSLDLYNKEPVVIACPTCSRTEINAKKIAGEVEAGIMNIPKHFKVAIMGCAVNGPGEAKQADYAIIGGRKAGAIYMKGRYIKTADEDSLASEFIKLIEHAES